MLIEERNRLSEELKPNYYSSKDKHIDTIEAEEIINSMISQFLWCTDQTVMIKQ